MLLKKKLSMMLPLHVAFTSVAAVVIDAEVENVAAISYQS